MGNRGSVVIRAKLRRLFGMEEGSYVVIEQRQDFLLLRPAHAAPEETYSPERKAELRLP